MRYFHYGKYHQRITNLRYRALKTSWLKVGNFAQRIKSQGILLLFFHTDFTDFHRKNDDEVFPLWEISSTDYKSALSGTENIVAQSRRLCAAVNFSGVPRHVCSKWHQFNGLPRRSSSQRQHTEASQIRGIGFIIRSNRLHRFSKKKPPVAGRPFALKLIYPFFLK